MLEKSREYPEIIKALTVLKTRISINHMKADEINEELAKRNAGYYGEKSVDYYLSLLPDEKFHLFGNLRLPNKNKFFQIDNLVLSPRYLLILEVKNILGELYFDRISHQFMRSYNGKKERFTEPILQARRQALQLKIWMKHKNLPDIPIEYLFVNSNPTAIFRFSDNSHPFHDKMIHAEYLLEKIAILEEKHQKPLINHNQTRNFISLLLKDHTLEKVDVLSKLSIKESDILRGVQCPKCGFLPMIRNKRAWECTKCLTRSSSAHHKALEDYFLLFSHSITNRKCRDFLLLESRRTAQKILKSAKLYSQGIKSATIYFKYK